jgi:hypothetical protein
MVVLILVATIGARVRDGFLNLRANLKYHQMNFYFLAQTRE